MIHTEPRIFALTIDHPLFYPEMWQKVLQNSSSAFQGVFFFERRPKNHPWLKYKMMESQFLGTKNIIKLLTVILKKQLFHFLKSREPLSVKNYFKEKGIPIYTFKSVHDPCFQEKLSALSPDLIISIGSHQIIPKKILDIPKDGILNKHGSLLPKYAGFWPLFWALYHDESYAGVTFHKMISKPDAGECIHQKQFMIHPNDTLYNLQEKSLLLTADMVIEILDYYCTKKNLPKFIQDPIQKDFILNEFPKRKHRLILERFKKRRIV